MRLAFMGTPDFAVPSLRALIDAGHDVVCVYTQPPRPAGRGQKARSSPIQATAEAAGIPVRTPTSLKGADAAAAWRALDLDVAVVAAYGLLLPTAVLEAPRHGCLNLHASLLPRWRGAAPIQRAIMAGDVETGITVMQMSAGLDEGDIVAMRAIPIGPGTTAGVLHDALATLAAEMIVDTLAAIDAGIVTHSPQPPDGVTYARKIDKAEARIDWTRPAAEVDRQIRALSPYPGAWFDLDGTRIKALASRVAKGTGAPGTALDGSLTVACGDGAICLLRLQRAGAGALDANAFLRGRPVPAGTQLGPT